PIVCPMFTLQPGDNVTITIHATAMADGKAANHAKVKSSMKDPVPSNNEAVDIDYVATGAAELAVSKTFIEDSAVVGSVVKAYLSVTNHGPAAAEDVI